MGSRASELSSALAILRNSSFLKSVIQALSFPVVLSHRRYYQKQRKQNQVNQCSMASQSYSSPAQGWKTSYLLFQTGLQTSLGLGIFPNTTQVAPGEQRTPHPRRENPVTAGTPLKTRRPNHTSAPSQGRSPINAPQYRNAPRVLTLRVLPLPRGVSQSRPN